MILISGAFAGIVHVVSGPDHLGAIAPLAASDRRHGWLAGWTWGIGHATGVMCIAALAVLLRDRLPPVAALSEWGERLVGATLIGVGLWAFRRSAQLESRGHVHDAMAHRHLHIQRGPGWLRRLGHAHAAFYVGILHGVAGSSHFFGVLPALALPSRAASLTYIGAFGAGTIAAMTLFAAFVGLVGGRLEGRIPPRGVMMGTSAAAVFIGVIWLMT